MRCSSAVVLSTLAVGQAAAANVQHRHASFHARREASKRDVQAVNWKDVAYDLKNVDWNKVNWSSVFASPAATPTPVVEQKKPEPVAATPTPEVKKESAPAAPSKPAESSKAAEPSQSNDSVGDVVDDIMAGVASIASAIGAKIGQNSKSPNGGIWVSKSGEWGMDVTNKGSNEAVWYCWRSNGFTGMIIKENTPEVSVGIKPGQTVSLSFAAGVPAACAPATTGSSTGTFGGLDETWAEVTFGKNGAFNVSKNPNMHGCSISMEGSKCTSNMSQCVFQCKDTSAKSCTYGYDLVNCDASNGGGQGYDPIMQGVGGGCSMAESGERLKISFS